MHKEEQILENGETLFLLKNGNIEILFNAGDGLFGLKGNSNRTIADLAKWLKNEE